MRHRHFFFIYLVFSNHRKPKVRHIYLYMFDDCSEPLIYYVLSTWLHSAHCSSEPVLGFMN